MNRYFILCFALCLCLAISPFAQATEVCETMPVIISGTCPFPGCGGILYQFQETLSPGLRSTRVCQHGRPTATDSELYHHVMTYDQCNRCAIVTNYESAINTYWQCNYRPAPAKVSYYTSPLQ